MLIVPSREVMINVLAGHSPFPPVSCCTPLPPVTDEHTYPSPSPIAGAGAPAVYASPR